MSSTASSDSEAPVTTPFSNAVSKVQDTLLQVHSEFYEWKREHTARRLEHIAEHLPQHDSGSHSLQIFDNGQGINTSETYDLDIEDLPVWNFDVRGNWNKSTLRFNLMNLEAIKPSDAYQSCASGSVNVSPRKRNCPEFIPLNDFLVPDKEYAEELSHFIWQKFSDPDCESFCYA